MQDGSSRLRTSFKMLVGVYAAMAAFIALLHQSQAARFTSFFGGLDPVLAALIVSIAGIGAFGFLLSRGGFVFFDHDRLVAIFPFAAAMATLLAAGMAFVDWLSPLPADLNVPIPAALLFYPAMGVVAETVFHIVPLAILLLVFGGLSARLGAGRFMWLLFVLVSLPEPIFQISGESVQGDLSLSGIYVALNVFVFSLIELGIFRRNGFAAMFTFRMVYYFWWHLVWGTLRLEILF